MTRCLSPRYAAVLFAMALGFSPMAAQAADQAKPLPAPAQAKVDAFFTQLKAGKVKEAYDGAFAGTLMSKKQAEFEQAIAGTETGLRYYGGVRDWQWMKSDWSGEGFVQVVYLVRMENAPLFMRLQLYDNGVRWIVYNINFSDNYDQASAW